MPFQFEVAALVHTFFFSKSMHAYGCVQLGPRLHSRVLSLMLSDNGEIYTLVVVNSCASTMGRGFVLPGEGEGGLLLKS